MYQLKVDILLPLYHNPDANGSCRKINGGEFSETYKDLINHFGGCTVDPAPRSGVWINPDTGQEITDEVVVYWIICEETKENKLFLNDFKEVLKKRFRQDEIMMYSTRIRRI